MTPKFIQINIQMLTMPSHPSAGVACKQHLSRRLLLSFLAIKEHKLYLKSKHGPINETET